VVAQSLLRNEFASQLYYGTTLIAVFGLYFLAQGRPRQSVALC